MKQTVFVVFCFFICCSCAGMSKDKNVEVILHVDSALCAEPQWVYMHYWRGNEFSIEDSVLLDRRDTIITLYGCIVEQVNFFVFFEKRGPNMLSLIVSPNDKISVRVNADDIGMVWKEVEGSEATNENAVHFNALKKMRLRELDLNGELYAYSDKDSVYLNAVLDSLAEQKKWLIDDRIRIINNSVNPCNVWSALTNLQHDKGVSPDSIAVLINEAKRKFPNHVELQNINHSERWGEGTEKSDLMSQRIAQLTSKKLSTFRTDEKKEQQEKQEKEKRKVLKDSQGGYTPLPPLRGRDALMDFTLESSDGQACSLSDLEGKYVLVDFWASWCIPCVKEMPIWKRIKDQYQDRVVVCLVSLDINRTYWRNAIKRHKLESFLNIIATNEQGELNAAIERLDIKTIPANYLLDEKGEIVAMDLKGQQLLDTLKKLFPKNK